ncbi:MAG: nucleoside-diphosphate kinase [Firmicutes bacterium]|nr:nucleoside-diphosphate kinase [Bacillota bacterium]
MERTYVMIKPDVTTRQDADNAIADIKEMILNLGLQITADKMFDLSKEVLAEHYAHIVSKPFYPEIEEFMTSGPVVGMIVEGKNAVEKMGMLRGPTDPAGWGTDTIRAKYGKDIGTNAIHSSDSIENAEIEIVRFFAEDVV